MGVGDERGAGCVAAPADVQIGRLRPAGRPCIGDQFETVANRWRDRPALDTGTECLSYGELRAAADLVARRIQRAGTAPSARVALMFQRPAALVPSLLGVLKAGCAYVPLDPTFPAARVAYVLKDSDASLVLCDSDTQDLARDLTGGGRPLIDVDELGPTSEPVPDRRIAPDDLASILYTSGSMGEPKGVVQTHRNLVQYARNYIGALDIRPTDRVSLLFSYSFSASVPDLFGTLLSGAALCPFDVKRNGAAALARWIRSAEISVLHLVPTVFRHLLPRLAEERELPSLRAVDLGGEALYPADVAAFHAHPGIRSVLVHRLAATEASLITQHRLSRDVPQGTRAVPVGHPVEGMEIRIEGPDGDVVAPGEPGEIVLRSRYLSPGYWRKPDLTERSFRNDPNEPGVRLYRTGDRGRVGESGMLEHLGRRDHRVKVRGFTVELTEIEAALRQQPGVRECVVATTGRDAAPVAFVVTGIDPPEGERELRRALGRLLPDYMVPARIEFVSDFPLTATGKIDRRRLLEGRDDPSERIPRLAPRTATEERLAQIWTDELEADAIDIRDDYFALGGTSLQAVQIMMRIEEQFGRDLTPSVLLDAPTIERLAALIDRDDFDEPDSLVVALRGSGSGAPLFCFPGNGGEPIVFKPLVRRIEREHPCYGVQSPGLLGNRPPARRIAEYARLQLEGIREIQPNGPYHFVAFSFGCTVAHEVARQLEGAGERVAFIAMIDGWAPGHPRLRQSAALVHRLLDRWLGPGLLARHRISPRKLIHQSAKARARDLECMVVERSGRRLSRSQRRRRLKREAIRARGRYRPRPFPGRILLVRAAKQPFETLFEFDRLRGWGPFAAGGIETLDLDATHVDLLHDEFAPAIATAVNALLARSRSGTSLIDREARGPRAQ